MIDDLVRLYLLRRHGLTCRGTRQVPDFRPDLRGGASSKEDLMHDSPISRGKPPVEAKVKWAAFGGYIGSVGLLAILQAVDVDHSLIAFWPDWLESLTIPLLPTAIGAVMGWRAKHASRPDLPINER